MSTKFNLHKEALDALYEGVYFVDTNRTIKYWNKAAERITGFRASEVIGRHCFDNILNHVDNHDVALCSHGCPLFLTIQDGESREAGVYLKHHDGYRIPVAIRTIPLYDNGKITGAVEVFINSSEQAEFINTINELKSLALFDPLTELPNRRYIETYLANRLIEYQRLKIPFSLAMVDIDFFKKINDTFGHDIGDEVLKMISSTMKNAVRVNDLVGRWGGEEFIIALVGVTNTSARKILEKIRILVARSGLEYQHATISVTISIGASMIQNSDRIDSILKRTDSALYSSKANGRNRITMF